MAREALSVEEYNECVKDAGEAFLEEKINEQEYREYLARNLGMNATDIESEVRRNRPRGTP